MGYWWRCLRAEALKCKRTLALTLVVAVPLALGALNFLLLLGVSAPRDYATEYGWLDFEHNTITFWAIIFSQATAILATALSAHQEHDAGLWRRLMCLPVPRGALYLAKLTTTLGLMAVAGLMVWVGNLGYASLYAWLRPDGGLAAAPLDLWIMARPFVLIYGLGLFMVAIHFVASLNVRNFVVSVGAGLVVALAGAGLHDYAVARQVVPWCLPTAVYLADSWGEMWATLAISGTGFVATAALGAWIFGQRDVLS